MFSVFTIVPVPVLSDPGSLGVSKETVLLPPYSWHSTLASSQVILTSENKYRWPSSQLRSCQAGTEEQNTRETRLLRTRMDNISNYYGNTLTLSRLLDNFIERAYHVLYNMI